MSFVKKPPVISPYSEEKKRIPDFRKRIRDNTKITGVNIIIIDGKSQTGKSTLADWLCRQYDEDFALCYTVEDVLKHFEKIKNMYNNESDHGLAFNRWIFWDEPQNEIPRLMFWSERNMVIQKLTSSFGFLKPSMVMALPNIKGLSEMVITNILFRISVKAFLKKDEVVRHGYVKVPLFNEIKNKFYWTVVEDFKIKELKEVTSDKSEYMKRKVTNFFTQLEAWRKDIS